MKLTTLRPRLATLVTQRIPTHAAGNDRLRGRAAVEDERGAAAVAEVARRSMVGRLRPGE